MKKFILSSLLVGLTFIGFSNAGTINCSNGNCSPSNVIFTNDIQNISYNMNGMIFFSVRYYDIHNPLNDYYIECDYESNTCNSSSTNGINRELQFVDFFCVDSNGEEIDPCPYEFSIISDYITIPGGGDTGGGDTGGGDGLNGSVIISGGFDNFIPAVNGLHETVKQLIPLVFYLGIGALLVTLGFIAIRWLVNWLSKNITSKFSSKRG